MSLESAIHAIGVADSTLDALIDGRMVRDSLPHGYTVPAVVYRALPNIPQMAHDGDSGVARARYQLDCWADDPGEAETLQNAVRDAYIGYRGTTGGRKLSVYAVEIMGSLPQTDTELSRRIVDILLWDEGDT